MKGRAAIVGFSNGSTMARSLRDGAHRMHTSMVAGTAEILAELKEDREPIVITEHERSSAVLVDVEIYDDLQSLSTVASQAKKRDDRPQPRGTPPPVATSGARKFVHAAWLSDC